MRLLLEMAAATHPGMVRAHNEDCMDVDAPAGLAVLADGMGGYNAGEVASRMAVDLVSSGIRAALAQRQTPDLAASRACALLSECSLRANAAIYEAAGSNEAYAGMGTTLVIGLWFGASVAVAHVGDSRLYRMRAGVLEQLTRDHSLLEQQIELGVITREEARYSPNRNVVTRAIGIDPDVDPEVHTFPVSAGDGYLICSDGLSDMLTDPEIRDTLAAYESSLPEAANELVRQANANGGLDNISVILIRVSGDDGSAAR